MHNETVSFLRHASFFGPEDSGNSTLNIIGVGATGSWVGMLAARMGWHNFQVWDLDIVESHNLPNQIYDLEDIGSKKVDAFETHIKRFNPSAKVIKHDCFYESDKHSHLLEDYVFVAVDSLSARKDIVAGLIDNVDVSYIFETKMGFSHAEINLLDPLDEDQMTNYLSLLKNDSEVQESACNERIITTLTTIVASKVVHALCGIVSSQTREKSFKKEPKQVLSLTDKLSIYSL